MGKHLRKCERIRDVGVMEIADVNVRTRARAPDMAAASSSGTAKRRKIGGGELKFSSSIIQTRSRCRRFAVTPENSVSPATPANSRHRTFSNCCSSSSSDELPVSCCSSNSTSYLAKESFHSVDLEDTVQIETSTCDFGCRGRREKTPSSEVHSESGDLESMASPTEENFQRKLPAEKMPTVTELEEFFVAAEKDAQKQFMEKYNYDIVKDAPLEGRYEWLRLKP